MRRRFKRFFRFCYSLPASFSGRRLFLLADGGYGTDRKTKKDDNIIGRRFLLCANYLHSKLHFKVETRSQSASGFLHSIQFFVFLSAFAIRSPSNPVCASLAGSLLQTGSWGDTASRKHPTGAFSLANLSQYVNTASGRKREFCTRLPSSAAAFAGAVSV